MNVQTIWFVVMKIKTVREVSRDLKIVNIDWLCSIKKISTLNDHIGRFFSEHSVLKLIF